MGIKILSKVILITMAVISLTACAALKGIKEEKATSESSGQDVARPDSSGQERIKNTKAIAIIAKREIVKFEKEETTDEKKPTPSLSSGEEPASSPSADETKEDKEEFSLNFDDANLYEVIDVLAKSLQLNYLIDPRVKGTVTIHTTGKISKKELLSIMEHILKINGVAMVKVGDLYKILPFSEAQTEPISPQIERGLMEAPGPTGGEVVIQIVPLKFISAMEMSKILKPFLTPGGDLYEFAQINLLIIADTSSNIQKLLQMVRIFDIQIFEKIKVEIFPVENTSAEDLAAELESIFSAYGLLMKDEKDKVGIKFIPVPRLNSILTIASNFELLSQAWDWVKKLDQMVEIGTGVYVYFVENVKAEDLANILNQVYGEEGVKPLVPKETARKKAGAPEKVTPLKGGVKVIPDKATNALVILATPEDYKAICQTVKKLDIVPRQVLIEVIIAEVSLEDTLEFGVEWWLKSGERGIGGELRERLGFGTLGAATFEAGPGGFWYTLFNREGVIKALLTTLATESKMRILSSPNILVSNNQEATISVGSEVPIVTGVVTTAEAAAVGALTTSIQYKDTGVILKVTPHINSVGLVTLDITQEYSEPKKSTVGGTETYEFLKRKAETSVVADKEQTVAIGGMIQRKMDKTRSGIPFLKDIPILGYLFGHTTETIKRTELMVLITPRVIFEKQEADEATREFRERLGEIEKMLESWQQTSSEKEPEAKITNPAPEDKTQQPSTAIRKSENSFQPSAVKEPTHMTGELIKDQFVQIALALQQPPIQQELIRSSTVKTRLDFGQALPEKNLIKAHVVKTRFKRRDQKDSKGNFRTLKEADAITDIESHMEGDILKVILTGNGVITRYKAFSLDDPTRLVVDVFKIAKAFPQRLIKINSPYVDRIRIGTHPDKVRLCLDSSREELPPHHILYNDNQLVIVMSELEKLQAKEPGPAESGKAK